MELGRVMKICHNPEPTRDALSPNCDIASSRFAGGFLFFPSPAPEPSQRNGSELRRMDSRNPSPTRRSRYNQGLTLIELLAVILIICITTMIAAPIMANYTKNIRLKSAASQVEELVLLARNLATTNNESYTLTIHTRSSATPNQIEIIKTSDSTHAEKTWIAPPLIEIPDVSGTDGDVSLTFTSYGTTLSRSIHIIQRGTKINNVAYSATVSYCGITNRAERVKCYTVAVSNTTSLPTTYYYGRGTRWSTNNL